MANDYVTAAEVRAQSPSIPASQDTLLTDLATKASRLIDRYCRRQPGAFSVSTDETRYFTGSGCLEQWIDELAAAPTTVAVAESADTDGADNTGGTYTTWAASDYVLWPYNALADGRPFKRLDIDIINGTKAIWYAFPRAVKITGKFGYSTTANLPPDIQEAALITVVRWFSRAQQGFRDTSGQIELGQLVYTKALDPDVKLILDGAGLTKTVI